MVFEDLSYKILPKGVLNYMQAGGCVYVIESVIWALIFSLSALSLWLIGKHLLKTSVQNNADAEENEQENEPLLDDNEIVDSARLKKGKGIFKPEQTHIEETKNTKYTAARCCIFISKVLLFISICCLAVIPSVMSSVDFIPVVLSIVINIILLLLILLIYVQVSYSALPSREGPQESQRNTSLFGKASYLNRTDPVILPLIAAAGLLFSFSAPLMTAKACLAHYSPDGTFALGAFHVSTAFTRLFAMPQVCPPGEICHIYSTLAEDGSTSVILNVHTGIDVSALTANYDTLDNFQENKALGLNKQGQSLKIDLEAQGARYVHSIYLDGLTPDTDYFVQFKNNGTKLGEANFSTFPTPGTAANIVMVGGGDSSGNSVGKYFTNEIAKYDPDVIFVGGDIVYDNGDYHCYYCWDVYLQQFEQLNQKVGRLVPIVLGIGNHDIGFSHNQFLAADPYQTYYYLYFPQHTKSVNETVVIPPPDERMSYFSHRIGNILLVTLDTGYSAESGGQQLTWLQNVANQNPDLRKFAHYHVAILPACEYHPEMSGYDERMFTWVPVFEENRFLTVFENHYHLFKRTFPIKTTTEEGPGVVYAGDGGWGINPDDCWDTDPDKNSTGIFERLEKLNHVWIIKSGQEKVEYQAINLNGEVFDSYTQNAIDYS